MDELKRRLKEKLGRNVKGVMDELKDLLKEDTENFNSITLLIGRFNLDRQNNINGTKTDDTELTKIRANVIDIIDSLEVGDLENESIDFENRINDGSNNSKHAFKSFGGYELENNSNDLDSRLQNKSNKKLERLFVKRILPHLYLLFFILITSLFICFTIFLKEYNKTNTDLNKLIKEHNKTNIGLNKLIKEFIDIEYTNQITELGKFWESNINIEVRKDLNAFIAWEKKIDVIGERENTTVLMLLAEGVKGNLRYYKADLFEHQLTKSLFKNLGIHFEDNIPNYGDVESVKTNFIKILNVIEAICEIRLQNPGHKERLDKLYKEPIQKRYEHLKPFKDKYEEKNGNAWKSIELLFNEGDWKINHINSPLVSTPEQFESTPERH